MEKIIIVPLDFNNLNDALAMAEQLDPNKCRVKVGKELFTSAGPDVVRSLIGMGFDVFLDMKYHDIPNTVAGAVRAAAELGVWMVNVHASGGSRMMAAAVDAVQQSTHKPILIAVTVLTSMDAEDLIELGINIEPIEQVKKLALLAQAAGMDGVVCSASEASELKRITHDKFCLVTPGIRPAGSAADDQRRIVTPHGALANGSDYLVIGRPIIKSADPAKVLDDILATLTGS
jgi:orotidine-5'-phosphate decarboxylase|tara:strand:+ start:1337 stop:2032 length:696 start_codon:yes stop_codon:yes gene_type:complete